MKIFFIIIIIIGLFANCVSISKNIPVNDDHENTIIMPEGMVSIIGYWNTDRGDNYYWRFSPDHTVSSGRKEADIGWIGTWTLSEYIGESLFRPSFAEKTYNLTVVTIPTESMTGESETFVIIVHIINRNRIYFQFENGNGEFLDRNNGIL